MSVPTGRHNSVFKRLLAAHRAIVVDQLSHGVASWDIYNTVVGRLMGLAEAEKLADDADYEISGGS